MASIAKSGCVVAPSEWTEDGPSMVTELSCGRRDSAADDAPSFGRAHPEFFVPIDDRAGLQQDRGHFGRSEHDEFVIAVDTGLLVQQRVPVAPHDGLRILPGILQ